MTYNTIIYETQNSRCRILMFDNKEVFFDEISKDGEAVYSKSPTMTYSRTPRDYFVENSKFLRSSEFTESDLEKHRPDLPLRLNCFAGLFWTNDVTKTHNSLNELLSSCNYDGEMLDELGTNEVVIYPSSQQLSLKKPVLLKNNVNCFTGRELLIKCFEIQKDHVKINKPYFSQFRLIPNGREEKRYSGIGIYRLGIKGNIPSYYLGGEMSSAESQSNESLIVNK